MVNKYVRYVEEKGEEGWVLPLVEHGFLTPAQAQRVLEARFDGSGCGIYQTAVRLGYITPETAAVVQAFLYRLPIMSLVEIPSQEIALKLVPVEDAWDCQIVPISIVGNVLFVVTEDVTLQGDITPSYGGIKCRLASTIDAELDMADGHPVIIVAVSLHGKVAEEIEKRYGGLPPWLHR